MKKLQSLLCALCLFGLSCTQQALPPKSDEANGLTAVNLNSGALFTGDVTRVPGWEMLNKKEQQAMLEKRSFKCSISGLAGTLATITFKEAKIIVMWYDYMNYYGMDSVSSANYACTELQNIYRAFSNKAPLDNWDNVLAGCREFTNKEVVYSGTLTRSGDYLEGTIFVKPGFNVATVSFINASNKMFLCIYNHYMNISGLTSVYGDFFKAMGDVDGWSAPTWSQSNYFLDTWSNTYWYPSVGDIGITQGYADSMCTMMMIP